MEQENKKGLENQEDLDMGKPNELDNDVEFKESTDLDEEQARKERLRARRLERRHRRNARISRCRTLKNFFIWLLGVFFLPIAIVASMFVIPVGIINTSSGEPIIGGKVYTGSDDAYAAHQDETDANYYKDLEKFSILELARYMAGDGMKYTTVSNFPVLIELIESLQDQTIINDNKFSDIVNIDIDRLKSVPINSLSSEIKDCIEVVATIESLGGASALGDFGGLNVFTEEENVRYFKQLSTVYHVGAGDGIDNTAVDFDYAGYYYKTKEIDGAANDNEYKHAFKGDKSLVDELSGLSAENKALVKIYIKELCKVSDVAAPNGVDLVLANGFDNRAENVEQYYYKTKEVDTSIEETVYKRAFNDDKSLVDELSSLSAGKKDKVYLYYPPLEKVKLSEVKDIIGDSIGRVTIKSLLDTLGGGNEKITDIFGEDTTVKGIGNFDINDTELDKVLPAPDDSADPESKAYKQNRKLYDILKDLTNNDNAKSIKIGDLSAIDTDDLHLNTVMGDVTTNRVLTALKEKDITVGQIGTALNDLSLYEVYGSSAFVEISAEHPKPDGARTFNKGTYNDKICFDYVSSGDGAYYLDNSAGIWLILCYDTVEYNPDESVAERFSDEDGNPTKYIADNLTIGDLSDGNSFSKKFRNSTLKQFIDTGLLKGDDLGGGSLSAKTRALSLQDIIKILARSDVQYIIENN